MDNCSKFSPKKPYPLMHPDRGTCDGEVNIYKEVPIIALIKKVTTGDFGKIMQKGVRKMEKYLFASREECLKNNYGLPSAENCKFFVVEFDEVGQRYDAVWGTNDDNFQEALYDYLTEIKDIDFDEARKIVKNY